MIDRVMSALLRVTGTPKVTPGKALDKIQQRPFTLPQNLAAESALETSKAQKSAKIGSPEPSTLERAEQLTYAPLPLRSELYEDARFYWKLRDFKYTAGAGGEAKVIFCLGSETLGQLWFILTSQPGSFLSVQCITEDAAAAETFKATSGNLKDELILAGFTDVVVSCRVQPGVRGISDLDPDFTGTPNPSLIDLQV